MISARQADDWGMIWEAVPDADFDSHWRAKAAQLANGPTAAYASAKKAIRETWDNSFEDQLSQAISESLRAPAGAREQGCANLLVVFAEIFR